MIERLEIEKEGASEKAIELQAQVKALEETVSILDRYIRELCSECRRFKSRKMKPWNGIIYTTSPVRKRRLARRGKLKNLKTK